MKKLNVILLIFSFIFIFTSCNKEEDKLKTDTQKIKDMDGWYKTGSKEDAYEIGAETEKYNGQPMYFLRSNDKGMEGFGTIAKNFNPVEYIGKRIRLSGNIKTEKVYGKAQMWLRIDGGSGNESTWGKMLEFDNMEKKPIRETTDWKKYEIVSDVPKESRMLFYGALLAGTGELWISDLKFEVVGNDVPLTTFIPPHPWPGN